MGQVYLLYLECTHMAIAYLLNMPGPNRIVQQIL